MSDNKRQPASLTTLRFEANKRLVIAVTVIAHGLAAIWVAYAIDAVPVVRLALTTPLILWAIGGLAVALWGYVPWDAGRTDKGSVRLLSPRKSAEAYPYATVYAPASAQACPATPYPLLVVK